MVRRLTIRLLSSELVKDGKVSRDITEEICKVFDGGQFNILIVVDPHTNSKQRVHKRRHRGDGLSLLSSNFLLTQSLNGSQRMHTTYHSSTVRICIQRIS
jgi:hypothetical protein